MKKVFLFILLCACFLKSFCWGFYAHKKINELSVFLLPPEMMVLYKRNIQFIRDHAVDADKRKGMIKTEGSQHFIDIDHYGNYPYNSLPRHWNEAIATYTEDTLRKYGVVPWHIERTLIVLTNAFKEKNLKKILKASADIGHYIADAHVPLHTNSNHNGQLTNQQGIHGFWESRIPELLAEKKFDLFSERAEYISNPQEFIWERILESASAADSVLKIEKELASSYPEHKKYAWEKRNKQLVKVYSIPYTIEFNYRLNNMVERRMVRSIHSIASLWLTAWVNAGQPNLKEISKQKIGADTDDAFEKLDKNWKKYNFEGKELCE